MVSQHHWVCPTVPPKQTLPLLINEFNIIGTTTKKQSFTFYLEDQYTVTLLWKLSQQNLNYQSNEANSSTLSND